MIRTLAALPLLAASAAFAQQGEAPPPPDIPAEGEIMEGLSADGEFEPEVTIVRRDGEVLEEYRINGQLYKVKVTPQAGPPYYLLYPHGEAGRPVRRELEEMQTPFWIIFSW